MGEGHKANLIFTKCFFLETVIALSCWEMELSAEWCME